MTWTARNVLVILLILTGVATTHTAASSWNDESRMATIQSLVERHSLVIEQSSFFGTGDKVRINGRFYSDKPPLPALLGAAVYFPLYKMGLQLHAGTSFCYYIVSLLTVSLAWGLGVLAFFSSLAFMNVDDKWRLRSAVGLGFGTTFFTWSVTFNNHEFAASFISIGLYFLLKSRVETRAALNVALAGAFFSLACASDFPTGAFLLCFFVALLCEPERRSLSVIYIVAAAITLIPTLWINYSIHGSITPVQIHREYFNYPGSPWLESQELSGVSLNSPAFAVDYAFRTLFGPNGFLLYNPFLFVVLAGIFLTLRDKRRFHLEAACALFASLIVLSYYWLTTNNYGGWSYSIRWFVPLIPAVFFFSYPIIESINTRWRYRGLQLLFASSCVIALVGAFNPWTPTAHSDLPFKTNARQILNYLESRASNR